MGLFVKIEKGIVDKSVFDRYVEAHKEFVVDLNRRGHKARSGYWAEKGGGMLLFEAVSIEEAEKIVAEDPLIKNGCVSYELHEWKIAAG